MIRFILLLLLSGRCLYGQHELVIGAVFQNESLFIKEWIEYHKLLGVSHFYLYNNLSSDNYQEILNPYMDVVSLFDWPVEAMNQKEYLELIQRPVYEEALKRMRNEAKWAAFIDLDEFIVPVNEDNMALFLEKYIQYPALAVNWQIFGPSEEDIPEKDLLIEHLTWKGEEMCPSNQYVKLIVQPALVEAVINAHTFVFREHKLAVNSAFQPLKGGQMGQPVIVDAIRLNHYWFGTRKWFLEHKLPRLKKWGMSMDQEEIDHLSSYYNTIYDSTILRFVSKLKETTSCGNSYSY